VDHTEFLRPTLQRLEAIVRFEAERTAGRHGIVSLSADGQLSDPSALANPGIEAGHEKAAHGGKGERGTRPGHRPAAPGHHRAEAGALRESRPALSFSEQIRQLAARPMLAQAPVQATQPRQDAE
jgi:hypothetical protein